MAARRTKVGAPQLDPSKLVPLCGELFVNAADVLASGLVFVGEVVAALRARTDVAPNFLEVVNGPHDVAAWLKSKFKDAAAARFFVAVGMAAGSLCASQFVVFDCEGKVPPILCGSLGHCQVPDVSMAARADHRTAVVGAAHVYELKFDAELKTDFQWNQEMFNGKRSVAEVHAAIQHPEGVTVIYDLQGVVQREQLTTADLVMRDRDSLEPFPA